MYVVTAKDDPLNPLQRAGHGDIVETPEGETYLVHLTGRPTTQKRRCVLGRETALQKAQWREDGWLYLAGGSNLPKSDVEVPGIYDKAAFDAERRYDFDGELHIDFQWLRTPETDRIFEIKEGRLRLYGRESITSWFEQALVARRQTHFDYEAKTELTFDPRDEREIAGLTAYYGRYNFHYLHLTADPEGRRALNIFSSVVSFPDGRLTYWTEPVPVGAGPIGMKVRVENSGLQFFYAEGGGQWRTIGPLLDASILSDECGGHAEHGNFTGAFVGMAAQDLNGSARPADFSHFIYRPLGK
jgi:xylan 1,4-beta-xylosidase